MLETNRLLLRPYDYSIMSSVFAKPVADQLAFFGVSDEADLEKPRMMYEGGVNTFNRQLLIFHMILKASNDVIGWCGFHTWYVTHDRAEVGYVIDDEKHWGKGYMSEALEAVIEYGFGTMKLHRIEAFVGPSNAASKRLLQKFGFQKEGLLREHYKVDGVHGDSEIYGRIKGVEI